MAESGRLLVRVQPGARRTEIIGVTDGVVRIRVAAPPVEGQANAVLIAFLAEALGLRPRALALLRGAASRDKVVAVEVISSEVAMTRLGLQP